MELVTTDTPAKLAANHINTILEQHNGDVLCLLAGGSALEIAGHIHKPANKSECRTIFMMGDERGSRDPKISNSLQLLTKLHPDSYIAKNFIPAVPEASEDLENFSTRISEIFSNIISELQNPKIIQVLGVGSDGHTAGIFPLPKEEFAQTYDSRDPMYAPVVVKGLTIDSRASVRPTWILEQADELIAYIAGESKKMILESLINESKEIHERPAELIKRHKRATIYTDQLVEQN